MSGSLNKVMLIGHLGADPATKSCERCGRQYSRPTRLSDGQWAGRRFCSKRCSAMKRTVKDQEIVAMYEAGHSAAEIGAVVGISQVHVSRIVREHGVTRPKSEAMSISHKRPWVREKLSAANSGRPCPEHVKEALRGFSGAKHNGWVCGLTLGNGYLYFSNSSGNGDHAGRALHRIVAEWKMGRALTPDEVVHHIDENKLNNHPDNLAVMTQSEHMKLHAQMNREKKACQVA